MKREPDYFHDYEKPKIGKGRITSPENQNLGIRLASLIATKLPPNYDPKEYTISCGDTAYFALKWYQRVSNANSRFAEIKLVRNKKYQNKEHIRLIWEIKDL